MVVLPALVPKEDQGGAGRAFRPMQNHRKYIENMKKYEKTC